MFAVAGGILLALLILVFLDQVLALIGFIVMVLVSLLAIAIPASVAMLITMWSEPVNHSLPIYVGGIAAIGMIPLVIRWWKN